MDWRNIVQRPPKVRLLYIHLPKTGGVSLTKALKGLYFDPLRPHRRFRFSLSVNSIRKTSGIKGLTEMELRDIVLHYGLINARDVRLATGHFRFTSRLIEQLTSDWRVISLFREPTSRWISEYYYNRYKESEHHQTDLDLASYMDSPAGHAAGSCYVRRFLSEAGESDDTVVTTSMVEEAKRNVARLDVIGVLERLEEFVADLKVLLERRLYVGHANRSPAGSRVQKEIDVGVRERIEDLCAPDIKLFEYVQDLSRRRHRQDSKAFCG